MKTEAEVRLADFFRDALKPAGRFKNPLTFTARCWIFAQWLWAMLREVFHGPIFMSDPSVPPLPGSWRVLLHYLRQQGVASEARVFCEQMKMNPLLMRAYVNPASVEGKTDGDLVETRGRASGSSLVFEESLSKAIGELLERYFFLIYRKSELIRASIADLERQGKHFLNPFLVSQFSDVQKARFPNRNFDRESTFYWARGHSVTLNREALIPAQLIFWNFIQAREEPVLMHTTTNGEAGMFSRDEAILSGLYELIEREAFLAYWLNNLAPPQIDLAPIRKKELRKLIDDCETGDLEVRILETTADLGARSFVAAVLGKGSGPAVSIGGGCGADEEEAIYRALVEAVNTYHWSFVRSAHSLPDSFEPFFSPVNQLERVLLWANPAMRQKFDFFLDRKVMPLNYAPPCPGDNPRKRLDDLLERFSAKGKAFEVFMYEAESAVLDRLGYRVVKTFVPGMIPLYLTEHYIPLASKRIAELGKYLSGGQNIERINSLPHPFP